MSRVLTVMLLILLAGSFPGCQSLKRTGKDIAVIATSPLTIPLDSVYESLDWGDESGKVTPILMLPFTVPGRIVKHALYTVVYAGDLVFSPIYLLASIKDDDGGLDPINLYALDQGYPWESHAVPGFED